MGSTASSSCPRTPPTSRLRVVCWQRPGLRLCGSAHGRDWRTVDRRGTSPEESGGPDAQGRGRRTCAWASASPPPLKASARRRSTLTGSSSDPPWCTPCSTEDPAKCAVELRPRVWQGVGGQEPQSSRRASTTHACRKGHAIGWRCRDNGSGCQPIPVLCRYRFSTLSVEAHDDSCLHSLAIDLAVFHAGSQ